MAFPTQLATATPDPELTAALTPAAKAKDTTELVAALRNLAATAERLASALESDSNLKVLEGAT